MSYINCRLVELKFVGKQTFMEAYCKVTCNGLKYKTRVYKASDKNVRAYWNETFRVQQPKNGAPITFNFSFYDENVLADELLGSLTITLSSAPTGQTQSYQIISKKSQHFADFFVNFALDGQTAPATLYGSNVATNTNAHVQPVGGYNPALMVQQSVAPTNIHQRMFVLLNFFFSLLFSAPQNISLTFPSLLPIVFYFLAAPPPGGHPPQGYPPIQSPYTNSPYGTQPPGYGAPPVNGPYGAPPAYGQSPYSPQPCMFIILNSVLFS
jgi:hypothetical protein